MYIFALPKNKRPVGQGVKTPPFHGGITSSNLVRATEKRSDCIAPFLMWQCGNVAMWQCGNAAMWECGNVPMWFVKAGYFPHNRAPLA